MTQPASSAQIAELAGSVRKLEGTIAAQARALNESVGQVAGLRSTLDKQGRRGVLNRILIVCLALMFVGGLIGGLYVKRLVDCVNDREARRATTSLSFFQAVDDFAQGLKSTFEAKSRDEASGIVRSTINDFSGYTATRIKQLKAPPRKC